MGRGRNVGRGVEIIAERRPERRLEAPGDRDLIEDRRPQVARRGGEELGQRARLGLEALRLALGLGEGAARARLGLARGRDRRAGLRRALLGFARHALGIGDFVAQGVRRRAAAQRVREDIEVVLDPEPLGPEARRALRFLAQGALEGGAAGVEIGDLRLQRGKRRLGRRELGFGRPQALAALCLRVLDALLGRGQLRRFAFEPRDRGLGIGALRRLPGDVLVEIGDVPLELGQPLLGAPLLVVELVAGMDEALQGGGRCGLGLAQAGKLVRGDGLGGGGFGLLARPLGDGAEVVRRLPLRRRRLLLRFGMADGEDQRLEPADFRRDVLVA